MCPHLNHHQGTWHMHFEFWGANMKLNISVPFGWNRPCSIWIWLSHGLCPCQGLKRKWNDLSNNGTFWILGQRVERWVKAVENNPGTLGSLIPGGGERVPTAVHAGLPCRFKARANKGLSIGSRCQTVYPMDPAIPFDGVLGVRSRCITLRIASADLYFVHNSNRRDEFQWYRACWRWYHTLYIRVTKTCPFPTGWFLKRVGWRFFTTNRWWQMVFRPGQDIPSR